MPKLAPIIHRSRPVIGVLWMLVTGLCFVAVTGIVKHIGDAVPPAQSGFLRYLLGLIFVIPIIPALIRVQWTLRASGLFALRGLIHSLGVIAWFYAIGVIPMAEVTAINYLIPVGVTLGAALFLGERLALRRMLAIGVAIAGVLIVLRPGFREISPGHLAMLGTAMSFAASYIIAKRVAGAYSAGVVVALLSIWVAVGLLPFALAVWVPVGLTEIAWLALTACFATLGHYAMSRAFEVASVAVTQPVTFLQLIWSVLLGITLFGEPADIWVIVGGHGYRGRRQLYHVA